MTIAVIETETLYPHINDGLYQASCWIDKTMYMICDCKMELTVAELVEVIHQLGWTVDLWVRYDN